MKLKLARMWDHNGTNMEAIGFMYRDYKTLIGLDANQEMTGQHPHLQLSGSLTLSLKSRARMWQWIAQLHAQRLTGRVDVQ